MIILSFSVQSLQNRRHRDIYTVAEGFADAMADGLGYANDITDIAVTVLDTHIHHTAAIGYPVESCFNLQPTFAVFFPDVYWHDDVGGIHVAVLDDGGCKLMYHYFLSCCLFYRLQCQLLRRDVSTEPTAELAACLIVHTTSTVFCHFERSEQKN